MSKILILDIETAPVLTYTWSLFKPVIGINMIKRDSFILSWAAKWYNEKGVMTDALPMHPLYRYDKQDDKAVIKSMWGLLDEADIVIAHNGNGFDIPRLNARFLVHGLAPPSPYKSIDTLASARKAFKLTSNKLDYIAQHLGVGKKVDTGGFELWEKCMSGHLPSWKKMIKYNKRDVKILEKVYSKMLPWINPHPSVIIDDEEPQLVRKCPSCGGTHIQKRGHYTTKVGKYKRYQCMECYSWSRERMHDQDKEERKLLLVGVA